MHPLTPNLSELKDDEIAKKISELSQRLMQSYRFGNAAMVQQIQMLLEDYQAEHARRQQKQLEEMLSKNKQFKDIIDVK
jgi:hypothetical protein